ncbi:MAG: hypothetical protein KIT84_18385 [Labilithrix sp.]|nr:hypothetical protein [Labilithrix sp.]MCW5813002.1 hypothetical protein [Labilithrix sp.]
MIDIPNIDANDLRAAPTFTDGQLSVVFAGSADSRSQDAIQELLRRVHAEAMRLQLPEVAIDFRDCDFVNSSCFKAFVVWLEQIQELDENQQYRLRFFSDDTKAWQRRSLQALSCFAIELVHIESKARRVGS